MAHFQDTNARPAFSRGVPAAEAQPVEEYTGRRNVYGARCSSCQAWVEAGQGRLENTGGMWKVSHIPPCPNKEAAPAPEATPTRTTFKVPDGRYTVVFADGHKTIRVAHQDEFDSFMPGKAVLSFLSGSNNDSDYTSFAHVDERGSVRIWKKHQGNERLLQAVKVLLGDPKAASQAYARESGCCGVCNRTLTTPESLAAGIGPECTKRVAW